MRTTSDRGRQALRAERSSSCGPRERLRGTPYTRSGSAGINSILSRRRPRFGNHATGLGRANDSPPDGKAFGGAHRRPLRDAGSSAPDGPRRSSLLIITSILDRYVPFPSRIRKLFDICFFFLCVFFPRIFGIAGFFAR